MSLTRSRDPFLQALDSLRLRAEQGAFGAGQPVIIIEEARRLRLSATPVREALAWMAGAGLVERAPLGGYVSVSMDAAGLRDALAFRLHCLRLSLETVEVFPSAPPEADAGAPAVLRTRLERLVESGGSAAVLDAYRRVSARLARFAVAEARVFEDVAAEAEGLAERFDDGDVEGLWSALSIYHHRRMDAAPLLVLEAGTPPPDGTEDRR